MTKGLRELQSFSNQRRPLRSKHLTLTEIVATCKLNITLVLHIHTTHKQPNIFNNLTFPCCIATNNVALPPTMLHCHQQCCIATNNVALPPTMLHCHQQCCIATNNVALSPLTINTRASWLTALHGSFPVIISTATAIELQTSAEN